MTGSAHFPHWQHGGVRIKYLTTVYMNISFQQIFFVLPKYYALVTGCEAYNVWYNVKFKKKTIIHCKTHS